MVNGEWAMVNGQNAKFFLHQKFTIHHSTFTNQNSPLPIHHCPFTIHHSPLPIHHCPFTIHHCPFTIRYPSALKISLKIFPADNSSMSLS